jgi:acyl carrier protein
MTSSSSTSTTFARVSAEVLSILRDDLNVDVSRVTQDARLVDDVGLDSVAFAVGMVPSKNGWASRYPKRNC